ncbi:MAG: DNA-binding transcriptional MerR regulator [Myxococcota bacterium]|jgi:DNA-binding transcriptional MerR regulator
MTLDTLEQTVRAMLDATGVEPVDARVARVPDRRTLRWYQSIGVMDKPLRYDGRKAIYGRRHALQAAAAKLLQATGYTLTQVQAALRGATDAQLEAALADAGGAAAPPSPAPPPAAARWRTIELAPGVLLTLDTRLVADPAAVITTLTTALGGPT